MIQSRILVQGGSSGSAVFNFVTEQIYALHAQSASDGTQNPTFAQSPTKNNPFPGNLAIPSDVWFSALEAIIDEEVSFFCRSFCVCIYIEREGEILSVLCSCSQICLIDNCVLELLRPVQSGINITNTCSTSNPGEIGYCSENCKCNQGTNSFDPPSLPLFFFLKKSDYAPVQKFNSFFFKSRDVIQVKEIVYATMHFATVLLSVLKILVNFTAWNAP